MKLKNKIASLLVASYLLLSTGVVSASPLLGDGSYKAMQSSLLASDTEGRYNPVDLKSTKVNRVVQEVLNDTPEIMYVKGWTSWTNGKITYNYYLSKAEIQKRVKLANDKADSIIKQVIKTSMTDSEKVKAIHDYIAKNTKYDYKNFYSKTMTQESHNAYGTLVGGLAVCGGYTKAVQLLLNKLDIENVYVSGYIDEGLHAWNMVKVDGKFYHMDVTFDDTVSTKSTSYDYFLKNDKDMKKTHAWVITDYPAVSPKSYLLKK